MEKLLPCPFCGRKNAKVGIDFFGGKYIVKCDCGAAMYSDEKDDVIKKWNTRKKEA